MSSKTVQNRKASDKKPKKHRNDISENYERGLTILATQRGLTYEELVEFLETVRECIVEEAADPQDKSIPDFDPPISYQETYDRMMHINELMNFFDLAFDRGDKDPWDSARTLFFNSFYGDARHVSRENITLDKFYQKVDELRALEEVTEGVEGIGKCLVCGSNKITVKVKGTRAADEAASVFHTCSNCKAAKHNIKIFTEDEKELFAVEKVNREREIAEILNSGMEAAFKEEKIEEEEEDWGETAVSPGEEDSEDDFESYEGVSKEEEEGEGEEEENEEE